MKKCLNDHLSRLSDDPYIAPYREAIEHRRQSAEAMESRLTENKLSLADFASAHEYFGLHSDGDGWIFREWAPNAAAIYLTGDFSGWQNSEDFKLEKTDPNGTWEIRLKPGALKHQDLYRINVCWPGGQGNRIPAYARRVVQDEHTKIFNAQVWAPQEHYEWKHSHTVPENTPFIYETHVGMAQERAGIGTYDEFRANTLPRIAEAGYSTIQLMAVMEHPYYGSFGYHVANFFSASSRFGTPEELKGLIDEAHGMGITVIMDLVHSHAVKNEVEGLSRFDGTLYQYFHEGPRGNHDAWDSRCFDYSKPEVLHFLLSNCRFWLDEYHVDGFRFDGITSMLYLHHGLGAAFDSYARYFDSSVDGDALTYLALANKVIHAVRPDAITIAEDVSGMPGLAVPVKDGGCGFDYRLAMGVPDCWFKLVNDVADENWDTNWLWYELTNRRADEKTISYAECHDQALVGGKTLIFEMIDTEIYDFMHVSKTNLFVDRGIALHKMIRLATLAASGHGYLNFMGNEFGHPEWVDFPREGNNWSHHYARRQWNLRDDPDLKYHFLADFDKAMIKFFNEKNILTGTLPRLLHNHNGNKVLAWERGGYFFVFNFNPDRSFTDYGIATPPGRYKLVFDTDEERFGGHARVAPDQQFHTEPAREHNEIRHYTKLYIPSRTALVIARGT